MYFKGNEEAPAEPALGEGGKENNNAGSFQLSTEIKGDELIIIPLRRVLWFIPVLD